MLHSRSRLGRTSRHGHRMQHSGGASMSQLIRTSLLSLVLTACASTPPPYQWVVYHNANHIPMQGLPAIPRLITPDRPTELVNFANEAERDEARQAAITAGAVGGAASMAVYSVIEFSEFCGVLPVACIGLVGIGAATGAGTFNVSKVPAEDAARLSAIFEDHATSVALSELLSQGLGNAGARDYPRLVVRLAAVVLVPTHDGVSFRLVAEAQGFPEPNQAWKPSVHVVPFPSRPVAEWLASDGRLLKNDIANALSALNKHVVSVYLPYEERRY
jgi:hypothetical protein